MTNYVIGYNDPSTNEFKRPLSNDTFSSFDDALEYLDELSHELAVEKLPHATINMLEVRKI